VHVLDTLNFTNMYGQATGQLADKPTRDQSSRGRDNSRTSQLANSKFLKIRELLYFIRKLNLTLTLTLSNIGSV